MGFLDGAKDFLGLQPARYYDSTALDPYYDHEYGDERYHDEASVSSSVESRVRGGISHVTVYADEDGKKIGAAFRAGNAVVFDLSHIEQSRAHSIVDFSAGLVFALEGTMRHLDARLFAVLPKDADFTDDELLS